MPFLFLKMGHYRPLFLYFRLFNTVDSKQMFHIKACWWLDLNRGPLVSEATALPTEPQPLPISYVWQIISFVNSSPIQKIDRPGLNVITKAALICQSSSCDFHKPINDSDQSSFFKIALWDWFQAIEALHLISIYWTIHDVSCHKWRHLLQWN